MKRILLFVALMMALTAMGQKKTEPRQSKNVINWSAFTVDSYMQARDAEPKWYVRQNAGSDTLEITAPKIRYIKIDGVVFEIVRTTDLKKAEDRPIWQIYNRIYDTGWYNMTLPINKQPKL